MKIIFKVDEFIAKRPAPNCLLYNCLILNGRSINKIFAYYDFDRNATDA